MRAFHETYGLPVLLTNCSNNYGPRQFPEKLIPLMICNALDRKLLPVYGTGANIRDWLHVEDHCAAIARVLEAGRVGAAITLAAMRGNPNLRLCWLFALFSTGWPLQYPAPTAILYPLWRTGRGTIFVTP